MNLNQLATFLHAARCMNFSRAASELNVTQPAVSAQIRQLESHLGVKLFARLGKKLVLTEPGEVLLGYARRIFSLRDEAGDVMNQMRTVQRGTLKLGTARTYAKHIMPPLLSAFQDQFPQVNIVLMEGTSLDMAGALHSLAVEVAVVAYPGPVRRVKFDFFKTEDLVLIVPPDHELAFAEGVTPERLALERLIMRDKGSGTRRVVADYFKSSRLRPRIVFETSNAEVIKGQVARGAGVSFLTRSAVYQDVLARRVAPANLDREPLKLDIYIATLEGHDLSRPARVFLDMLRGRPVKVGL